MTVEDTAAAPREPPAEQLRDLFWVEIRRLTLGLLRARGRRIELGPLTLLSFGPPQATPGGWCWEITGGLIARSPGGELRYSWSDGELRAIVEDYRPLLPGPLYRLVQLPLHHLITRLYLLRLRGPEPAAGPPAEPGRVRAAAAVDLGLCLGVIALLQPQRPVRSALALAAAYQATCWTLAGRTLGQRALGLRVAALDGRPVGPGQALIRLVGGGRASATVVLRAY